VVLLKFDKTRPFDKRLIGLLQANTTVFAKEDDMEAKDRILVALDVPTVQQATELVKELSPWVGGFKMGLELINGILASLLSPRVSDEEAQVALTLARPFMRDVVEQLFWDGKIHDIPNTVAGAITPIVGMGVRMINIHASTGIESIKAAATKKGNALLLGVTVLTSIDSSECVSIFGEQPGFKVLQFARELAEGGGDGIICSPQELEILSSSRDEHIHRLRKITPGIRPAWAATGDQRRVTTPGDAVRGGADYLVIGRPITQPPEEIGSRVKAAQLIAEEIAGATR